MKNKKEIKLEYRMYGLVPYNISPIQQGIQFGHAVVRYGRMVKDIKPLKNKYNKWAEIDQTFIILNGGTTNINKKRLGTLNQHLITLREKGILVQDFYEPDLGDQLTAICFLVDERVWNIKKYPDYVDAVGGNYNNWVKYIGGKENEFLREYLTPLRLA